MSTQPLEVPSEAAATVAALEAQSRRFETPCGQDGSIAWRVWGEGPPLLLVHGSQGSWTHWFRNIPGLAQRWTLYVPDLPGHGQSALPTGDDMQRAISDALAQGLRQLLGDSLPIDSIGFSFGALALSHLDASHPGLLRRIVLVDAGGIDTPHGHFVLKRISGLRGAEREAVIGENLLSFMLTDPASVDPLTLHIQATNITYGRGLNFAELVLPDKLLRTLPRVQAQIDAIWGDSDAPHPDPVLQEAALRTVKPDIEFHVIERAGHWAMYERPEVFNRLIAEMLAKPLR